MAEREFSVEITESDLEVLQIALSQYQQRCKQNSVATQKGYRSGASQMKRDEWLERADQVDSIMEKLLENAN